MSNEDEHFDATSTEQRRVLVIVLVLNLMLAVSLAVTGVLADSSGLIANALDNASDAAVYAISLFAVGRSLRWKRIAAACSGVLLLIFALGVLGDTVRRFVTGSEPMGFMMMAMAVIAAAVNLLCLRLLARLKKQDVNLRAAQTFSVNDFISNGGVLVAGGLVAWTGRLWPDLLVGLAVVGIALKGGVDILRDARRRENSPRVREQA
jgi:cobalt-zinc-cadmium efflux system protein